MFEFIKHKLKKPEHLYKFEMLGFTDIAIRSFDYLLANTIRYKYHDSETGDKLKPATFRYDDIEKSFFVNFKDEHDVEIAMELATYFSQNKSKFFKPVIN